MKVQILNSRPRLTKISTLVASISKPFAALLLIVLTLISSLIINPVLSQPAGNNQDSDTQNSPMLPLTIFRQRLNKVADGSEQLSFQPVGIGESFAVPPGSSIIVGNPPYPYQFTKANIDGKNKNEFKEIIRNDGERSGIVIKSTQK
jgi:hypothetical protein